MSFKVNIYIATTWRSPKQRKGATGWLVEFVKSNGAIETRPREGPGVTEIEGTETQATLTALIAAVKILVKQCEIRIFTLNNGILAPLENGWLEKWRANNFQTTKGEQVKNYELWKEVGELLEQHTYKIKKGLGSYKLILPAELQKNVDFTLKKGK